EKGDTHPLLINTTMLQNVLCCVLNKARETGSAKNASLITSLSEDKQSVFVRINIDGAKITDEADDFHWVETGLYLKVHEAALSIESTENNGTALILSIPLLKADRKLQLKLIGLAHDVNNALTFVMFIDICKNHGCCTPALQELGNFCLEISKILHNLPTGPLALQSDLEGRLLALKEITQRTQQELEYSRLHRIISEAYQLLPIPYKTSDQEEWVEGGIANLIFVKNMLAHFFPEFRGQLKAVNLSNLLETVKSRRLNIRKLLQIESAFGDIEIVTDEVSLTQAIVNIVINAHDAMVANNKKDYIRIKVELAGSGEYLEITISDKAGGISPQALPHIFEPGFSTKTIAHNGIKGMGLDVAQKCIAEYCQGSISVQTDFGIGTTFTIRLPMRPQGPEASSPVREPVEATPAAVSPLREMRLQLGRLIIFALRKLTLRFPKEGALVSLQNQLEYFQKQKYAVTIPDGGKWSLTPLKLSHLMLVFDGLVAGATYTIFPYWKEAVGLVIYFVRENEVIGFSVNPFLETLKHKKPRATYANILVRAANLDTAIKNTLKRYLKDEWGQKCSNLGREEMLYSLHIAQALLKEGLSSKEASVAANSLVRSQLKTLQRLVAEGWLTAAEKEAIIALEPFETTRLVAKIKNEMKKMDRARLTKATRFLLLSRFFSFKTIKGLAGIPHPTVSEVCAFAKKAKDNLETVVEDGMVLFKNLSEKYASKQYPVPGRYFVSFVLEYGRNAEKRLQQAIERAKVLMERGDISFKYALCFAKEYNELDRIPKTRKEVINWTERIFLDNYRDIEAGSYHTAVRPMALKLFPGDNINDRVKAYFVLKTVLEEGLDIKLSRIDEFFAEVAPVAIKRTRSSPFRWLRKTLRQLVEKDKLLVTSASKGKDNAGSSSNVSASSAVDKRNLTVIFPHDDFLGYLFSEFTFWLLVSNRDISKRLRNAYDEFCSEVIESQENIDREWESRPLARRSQKNIVNFYKHILDVLRGVILKAERFKGLNLLPKKSRERAQVVIQDTVNFVTGLELLLDTEEKEIDINDVVGKLHRLVFSLYYSTRNANCSIKFNAATDLPKVAIAQDKFAYLLLSLFLAFRATIWNKGTFPLKVETGRKLTQGREYITIKIESPNINVSLDNLSDPDLETSMDVGYPLACDIVREFGGEIGIIKKNKKAQGFKVLLPVKSPASSAVGNKSTVNSPPSTEYPSTIDHRPSTGEASPKAGSPVKAKNGDNRSQKSIGIILKAFRYIKQGPYKLILVLAFIELLAQALIPLLVKPANIINGGLSALNKYHLFTDWFSFAPHYFIKTGGAVQAFTTMIIGFITGTASLFVIPYLNKNLVPGYKAKWGIFIFKGGLLLFTAGIFGTCLGRLTALPLDTVLDYFFIENIRIEINLGIVFGLFWKGISFNLSDIYAILGSVLLVIGSPGLISSINLSWLRKSEISNGKGADKNTAGNADKNISSSSAVAIFSFHRLLEQGYTVYKTSGKRLLFTLRSVDRSGGRGEVLITEKIDVFDLDTQKHIAYLDFEIRGLRGYLNIAHLNVCSLLEIPFKPEILNFLNELKPEAFDLRKFHKLIALYVEDDYRNRGKAGVWNADEILVATALEIAYEKYQARKVIIISTDLYYWETKFKARLDPELHLLQIILTGPKRDYPHLKIEEQGGKAIRFLVEEEPAKEIKASSPVSPGSPSFKARLTKVLAVSAVTLSLLTGSGLLSQWWHLRETNVLLFNIITAAIFTPFFDFLTEYLAPQKARYPYQRLLAEFMIGIIQGALFAGLMMLVYRYVPFEAKFLMLLSFAAIGVISLIVYSFYKKAEERVFASRGKVDFSIICEIAVFVGSVSLTKYLIAAFLNSGDASALIQASAIYSSAVIIWLYNRGKPVIYVYERWGVKKIIEKFKGSKQVFFVRAALFLLVNNPLMSFVLNLRKQHRRLAAEKVKTILFMSREGIGDAIMQTPVLELLHKKFPSAKIVVLANKENQGVFKYNPHVSEITLFPKIPAGKKTTLGEIIRMFILFWRNFDLCVLDIAGSGTRSKMHAFLTRSKFIIADGTFYPKANRLVDDLIMVKPGRHQVDMNLQVINESVLKKVLPVSYTPRLILNYAPGDKNTAQEFLSQRGVGKDILVIGLHIGSDKSPAGIRKRWPFEYFMALSRMIKEKFPQAAILVFKGPNENGGLDFGLLEKNGCTIVEGFSLLEVAALIERCNLFIANDSGLGHVAAARNIPVISIFGPSKAHQTRPYGRRVTVMQQGECLGCFGAKEPFKPCQGKISCLAGLTPDMVFAVVKSKVSSSAVQIGFGSGRSGAIVKLAILGLLNIFGAQQVFAGKPADSLQTKSIGIDTAKAKWYFERGWLAYRAGDMKSALAYFEKLRNLDPNDEIYYNTGLCRYFLDEFDEAVDDFTKSLGKKSSWITLYHRALAYYQLSADESDYLEYALFDLEEAVGLEEFQAATAHEKAEIERAFGLIYLAKHGYREAIAHYEKAVALEPNNGHAYVDLGVANSLAGANRIIVQGYFKQAIKLGAAEAVKEAKDKLKEAGIIIPGIIITVMPLINAMVASSPIAEKSGEASPLKAAGSPVEENALSSNLDRDNAEEYYRIWNKLYEFLTDTLGHLLVDSAFSETDPLRHFIWQNFLRAHFGSAYRAYLNKEISLEPLIERMKKCRQELLIHMEKVKFFAGGKEDFIKQIYMSSGRQKIYGIMVELRKSLMINAEFKSRYLPGMQRYLDFSQEQFKKGDEIIAYFEDRLKQVTSASSPLEITDEHRWEKRPINTENSASVVLTSIVLRESASSPVTNGIIIPAHPSKEEINQIIEKTKAGIVELLFPLMGISRLPDEARKAAAKRLTEKRAELVCVLCQAMLKRKTGDDIERAIAINRAAIQEIPASYQLRLSLSKSYELKAQQDGLQGNGNFKMAILVLIKALQDFSQTPAYPIIAEHLAGLLHFIGKRKSACIIEKSHEILSTVIAAYCQRGGELKEEFKADRFMRKLFKRLIEDYQKVIKPCKIVLSQASNIVSSPVSNGKDNRSDSHELHSHHNGALAVCLEDSLGAHLRNPGIAEIWINLFSGSIRLMDNEGNSHIAPPLKECLSANINPYFIREKAFLVIATSGIWDIKAMARFFSTVITAANGPQLSIFKTTGQVLIDEQIKAELEEAGKDQTVIRLTVVVQGNRGPLQEPFEDAELPIKTKAVKNTVQGDKVTKVRVVRMRAETKAQLLSREIAKLTGEVKSGTLKVLRFRQGKVVELLRQRNGKSFISEPTLFIYIKNFAIVKDALGNLEAAIKELQANPTAEKIFYDNIREEANAKDIEEKMTKLERQLEKAKKPPFWIAYNKQTEKAFGYSRPTLTKHFAKNPQLGARFAKLADLTKDYRHYIQRLLQRLAGRYPEKDFTVEEVIRLGKIAKVKYDRVYNLLKKLSRNLATGIRGEKRPGESCPALLGRYRYVGNLSLPGESNMPANNTSTSDTSSPVAQRAKFADREIIKIKSAVEDGTAWIEEIDGEKVSGDNFALDFYARVLNQLIFKLRNGKLGIRISHHIENVLWADNKSSLPIWHNQPFAIILRELLRNAVESVGRLESRKGSIEFAVTIKQGNLEFSVQDEGVGLKGVNHNKIFQKGFTTKVKCDGCEVGRGLYLSRNFVRATFGVEIQAFDNERDLKLNQRGATFKAVIPLAQNKSSSPVAAVDNLKTKIRARLELIRVYPCPLSAKGKKEIAEMEEALKKENRAAPLRRILKTLKAPPSYWLRSYFEGMTEEQIFRFFAELKLVVNICQGCSIYCDICLVDAPSLLRIMPWPWIVEIAQKREELIRRGYMLKDMMIYFSSDPLKDYFDPLYKKDCYDVLKLFPGANCLITAGIEKGSFSEKAAAKIAADKKLLKRLDITVSFVTASAWIKKIGVARYVKNMRRLMEIFGNGTKIAEVRQRPKYRAGEEYEKFKKIKRQILKGFRVQNITMEWLRRCGRSNGTDGDNFMVARYGMPPRFVMEPFGNISYVEDRGDKVVWETERVHPTIIETIFRQLADLKYIDPVALISVLWQELHIRLTAEEAKKVATAIRKKPAFWKTRTIKETKSIFARTRRMEIVRDRITAGFIKEYGSSGWNDKFLNHLELALEERITNALKHGVGGATIYDHFGEESFEVRVENKLSSDKQFDLDKISNPTLPDNVLKESGRGEFLIKSFVEIWGGESKQLSRPTDNKVVMYLRLELERARDADGHRLKGGMSTGESAAEAADNSNNPIKSITALKPLDESPFWTPIRVAVENFVNGEAFSYRTRNMLRSQCRLWIDGIKESLETFGLVNSGIEEIVEKYYYVDDENWSMRDHYWLEIKLKDNPRWFVLDGTIGQFADRRFIKSAGGLAGLRKILREEFIQQNRINNDTKLLIKFSEFASLHGYYGPKDGYPFICQDEFVTRKTSSSPVGNAANSSSALYSTVVPFLPLLGGILLSLIPGMQKDFAKNDFGRKTSAFSFSGRQDKTNRRLLSLVEEINMKLGICADVGLGWNSQGIISPVFFELRKILDADSKLIGVDNNDWLVEDVKDSIRKRQIKNTEIISGSFSALLKNYSGQVDTIRIMNVLCFYTALRRREAREYFNQELREGGLLIAGDEHAFVIYQKQNSKLIPIELNYAAASVASKYFSFNDSIEPLDLEEVDAKIIFDKINTVEQNSGFTSATLEEKLERLCLSFLDFGFPISILPYGLVSVAFNALLEPDSNQNHNEMGRLDDSLPKGFLDKLTNALKKWLERVWGLVSQPAAALRNISFALPRFEKAFTLD
ncbi:MAG: ATP-binding protein, partial [Candidatus Omnitrophota bacterium]|nr:ATP-binding protein [Candidatus Omnitrophota bacterium]